jgi:hypothetical protein
MQQLIIKYYVSREIALTEGRAEYGNDACRPTENDFVLLSIDERKHLDRLGENYTFHLPTGNTNWDVLWPNIVNLIKTSYEQFCTKRDAEAAAREDKIVKCLARPDEEWFTSNAYYTEGHFFKTIAIMIPVFELRDISDERLIDRIASLKPELAIRQAQIQEENEKVQARIEEETLQKRMKIKELTDKKAEAIENLTEWCATLPTTSSNGPDHLKRGAEDGYDIVGGCLQWFAENIFDQFGGGIVRENTEEWKCYSWKERKSPGRAAFSMFDKVKYYIGKLAHPSSIEINMLRIMHVEISEDVQHNARAFTAVIVKIEHLAAANRYVVIEVS